MPWEPLPGSTEREPTQITEALDQLAKFIGSPSSTAMSRLFSGWEKIIGPTLAAICQPLSIKDGTLTLSVSDPAWVTQVRFLENEIISKVADHVGEGSPERLDVRVRRANH